MGSKKGDGISGGQVWDAIQALQPDQLPLITGYLKEAKQRQEDVFSDPSGERFDGLVDDDDMAEFEVDTEARDVITFGPQPGPQELLLLCVYTYIMFGGARGGGKTFAVILFLHQHALRYGRASKSIVFRRTYPELEDFREQGLAVLPLLGWTYRVGDRIFLHPSGAFIKLRFLEKDKDADKYQGHNYSVIVIEESGNFKDRAPLNKLRACLRSAAGAKLHWIETCNPGGVGHDQVKARWIEPAPPLTPFADPLTGESSIFIPSKLSDNKLLLENDPHYANRLKGSGPEWLVRAWLHGDWDTSPAGNVFNRSKFKTYTHLMPFSFIAQAWDTAYEEGEENDYSVCTTWGIGPHAYYLLDMYREKVPYPDLKRMVATLAARWGAQAIWVENQSSGRSIVQDLRRNPVGGGMRLPIIPVQIPGDKVAKAVSVTPIIDNGLVYIPENAPWKDVFLNELSSFPNTTNDDIVDSVTIALTKLVQYTNRLQKIGQGGRHGRKMANGFMAR